jgi:hypothetical protein
MSRSVATYEAVRESGALSPTQWEVYDALFLDGPLAVEDLEAAIGAPVESELLVLESLSVVLRGATGWDVTAVVPRSATAADREFLGFHEANPEVYAELRDLARQAVARGRKCASIKMLFEVVRWERYLRTTDPDFKLNNNFHSRYARLLMAREPELRGLFELRELRS